MKTPSEVVTQLFISTDENNWKGVEETFAPKVNLDYSSMNGNPAVELTPAEITTAWSGVLPGFESTHHQIGNFVSNIHANSASVFCYGTATHFLPDSEGNVWIVVGTYDFELIKNDNGNWKISSMKFNFKYQDGNTSLVQKAIDNLK